MKATEFADFFEFWIEPTDRKTVEKANDECVFNYADLNADKFYRVVDGQGCFRTRYISDIKDLAECFDSLLNDYIDEDVESAGFEYSESNPKTYYEQMLDYMLKDKEYAGVCEIVRCLVNPSLIEDDVERKMHTGLF